jgi:hypothetical protein
MVPTLGIFLCKIFSFQHVANGRGLLRLKSSLIRK